MCDAHEDIEALVWRANIAFQNEPGFQGAIVDGENSIRYHFDTPMNAERFEATRSLASNGNGVAFRVDGSDVIEQR